MVQHEQYRLDKNDLEIIRMLSQDCRTSYRSIVLTLGVTTNTIKLRIQKLIANNIIEKFVAHVNRALLFDEILISCILMVRYKEEMKKSMSRLQPPQHLKRRWVKTKPSKTGELAKIKCIPGGHKQLVTSFVETTRLTPIHDENLQQCTRELNAILRKYSSKSKDPKQELVLLETSEGLFVAWTENAIGAEDEDETILKSLGIK